MESMQMIDMEKIKDPKATVDEYREASISSSSLMHQQERSMSISCLAGLDALALACAAEQSIADGGTSTITKTDPHAESLPVDRHHSSSDDRPYPPEVSFMANYISQDLLQEIPSYISVNDVLCGRGGLTNHHPGNIFFRNLVRSRQEEYLRASKRDKSNVAKEIVDMVRNQEPPGRFLKKVSEKSNAWTEIGDRKAREKTSQALREGAPELRGEIYLKSPDAHFPGIYYHEFIDVIRGQVARGKHLENSSENSNPGLGDRDDDRKTCEVLRSREGETDIHGNQNLQGANNQYNGIPKQDSKPSSSFDINKDQTEYKSNILGNFAVTTANMVNSSDASSDSMSISSLSSLPRPRVVSSDSIRSSMSLNSSDMMIDVSGVVSSDTAFNKRQKVRHRSFTDPGETADRKVFLTQTARHRFSTDGMVIQGGFDIHKGSTGSPKLEKVRFQVCNN